MELIGIEEIKQKKAYFLPGLILLIITYALLVIWKVSYQLFSYGILNLTAAGTAAIATVISLVWAASNVGNPNLKQAEHLARGIVVGTVLFIVYHVPVAIKYFLS